MAIYLILGILIGIIIAFLVKSKFFSDDASSKIEQKLNEIVPNSLSKAIDEIIKVANEKLKAENQDIKTDLSNKKTAIEDLIKQVKDEIKQNNRKVDDSEKERVGSFRALQQALEGHKAITEQLSASTEGLKKILSNNQLRGQFGEQVAEDLLKMSGFVNEVDYLKNKRQEDSSTRPDFTILLPDGMKINVDAKFPYSNLQKMTETEDKSSKREYVKAFEADIREKFRQVTTRDYINPADNTVDFVIMFIPNEMIFSFIYDRMDRVWSDGMKQKVILAGPFNFTAVLRLIRQSYSNFKYQKNIHKIITFIKVFEEEFRKYNEEFEKIGIRINALSEQYLKVNSTRTKQLIRTVDKIKLEESESNLISEESIASETERLEIRN
ncbi:MAG: DNA recombination protein RmuC [Candidatus Levybacteria bacterium]|nr:DNA recombination protein RmuC [Candidatus Levybacteria bacterium]